VTAQDSPTSKTHDEAAIAAHLIHIGASLAEWYRFMGGKFTTERPCVFREVLPLMHSSVIG
jgi:hypothetical protein